jgi:endonuclease III
MTPKQVAEKISIILSQLYPSPGIPLQHKDPYTLLIAVLMSAHCTDAQVNKVTPGLFAKASTPEAMIHLSVDEIAHCIRSCGLFKQKAQHIWSLSKILIEKYGGVVPEDLEALETLPGVGHKTASVVVSQAFHHSAFPVDTHIHRCAARWGLSSGKNVKQTEKDLKALFPETEWNLLHLRIIYFAREYCQARRHDSKRCPICSWTHI